MISNDNIRSHVQRGALDLKAKRPFSIRNVQRVEKNDEKKFMRYVQKKDPRAVRKAVRWLRIT